MLRVALLGCGRIAQLVHLRALAGLPGASVVALAEAHPERLRAAANRVPGAQTFADYRELLDRSVADAVLIALPPTLHATAAVAAFGAGKHVFLEKPGATSREEAARVTAAWRSAGTVGIIGFNQRFHPMYGELRRAIARETLGDVIGVRTVFTAAPRGLPPWKQRRASGGGVLLDLAVHHVDLLRFIFDDEIAEASAFVRSVRSESDTAVLNLRLQSGPFAQIFVSMTTSAQDAVEIYGTAGRLTADRYGSGKLESAPQKRRSGRVARAVAFASGGVQQLQELIRPAADRSHARAFEAFAAAIRGEPVERLPDPDDAYRSLDVIFSAESAADRTEGLPSAARSAQAVAPS